MKFKESYKGFFTKTTSFQVENSKSNKFSLLTLLWPQTITNKWNSIKIVFREKINRNWELFKSCWDSKKNGRMKDRYSTSERDRIKTRKNSNQEQILLSKVFSFSSKRDSTPKSPDFILFPCRCFNLVWCTKEIDWIDSYSPWWILSFTFHDFHPFPSIFAFDSSRSGDLIYFTEHFFPA